MMNRYYIGLGIAVITFALNCTNLQTIQRRLFTPTQFQNMSSIEADTVLTTSPFLKVHMKNGNLYVLNQWGTDSTRQIVHGTGVLLNSRRDTLRRDTFAIGMDSVALLETNELRPAGPSTAITVFTGITAFIAAYCIANPKACFGSCPTFYTSADDSIHPDAEGFSASISPSLEATDIDALFHARADSEQFSLIMKNEALETHVVRYVDLLVAPKSSRHSRVLVDDTGTFRESPELLSPTTASAPEGDCLPLLIAADRRERFSTADENNLATKEFIELEFNRLSEAQYGVIIGCRQTLLSTYLLYQTYAYMGSKAGYWLAQIERNKLKLKPNSIVQRLGGIDIAIRTPNDQWQAAGRINEYGPLAIDFHLVPIPEKIAGKLTVRLTMTKGNWRIDYVGLARLTGTVKPIRLQPVAVLKDGIPDMSAYTVLCDSSKQLVSMPGDTYTLVYFIPKPYRNGELFIRSRGYYLEWIRNEWIAEENPNDLLDLFLRPEVSLKRLAPEFKQVESGMEECFWRSRYERQK